MILSPEAAFFTLVGFTSAYYTNLLWGYITHKFSATPGLAKAVQQLYFDASHECGIANTSPASLVQRVDSALSDSHHFNLEVRQQEAELPCDAASLAPATRSILERYDQIEHPITAFCFGASHVRQKANRPNMVELGGSEDSGSLCVFPHHEIICLDVTLNSREAVIVPVAESILHWIVLLDFIGKQD